MIIIIYLNKGTIKKMDSRARETKHEILQQANEERYEHKLKLRKNKLNHILMAKNLLLAHQMLKDLSQMRDQKQKIKKLVIQKKKNQVNQ